MATCLVGAATVAGALTAQNAGKLNKYYYFLPVIIIINININNINNIN